MCYIFPFDRMIGIIREIKSRKGRPNSIPSLSISLWSIRCVDTYADSISLVVILSWLTRERDKDKPASNLNLKEATDKMAALMSLLKLFSL